MCSATENTNPVPVGDVLWGLAVVCVLIHAWIFIKRTKKADPSMRKRGMLQWAILALVLGPFAWFMWRCYQQKRQSHPRSQQLLSDYDGLKGAESNDSSLI